MIASVKNLERKHRKLTTDESAFNKILLWKFWSKRRELSADESTLRIFSAEQRTLNYHRIQFQLQRSCAYTHCTRCIWAPRDNFESTLTQSRHFIPKAVSSVTYPSPEQQGYKTNENGSSRITLWRCRSRIRPVPSLTLGVGRPKKIYTAKPPRKLSLT